MNIISVESEFKILLDTFKRLGIAFTIEWTPGNEWQAIILEAGYNITFLATTVIATADREYLFTNGPIVYTEQEESVGPNGLFLLARNTYTKEIIPRQLTLGDDGFDPNVINLEAIERTYPFYPWNLNGFRLEPKKVNKTAPP
jgi:hypothetical protein